VASDPFEADLPTLRREARQRSVELLYEAHMKDRPASEVLAELPVAPDPLVTELVGGVSANEAALDELVDAHLVGWRPERVVVLDRAILRLGIYELLHRPEVSVATIIDEGVELAKRYSGPEHARFVNGVLSAVAREVRPG
jgi:N utilization substance protein B